MMKLGLKGKAEEKVSRDNIASSVGNPGMDVYATPFLVALMEKAAMQSLEGSLEKGQGSVGTKMEVRHLAATPPGMTVRCESELVEQEKNRLLFKLTAYDDLEKVAEAVHERYIVRCEEFLKKAEEKAEKQSGALGSERGGCKDDT